MPTPPDPYDLPFDEDALPEPLAEYLCRMPSPADPTLCTREESLSDSSAEDPQAWDAPSAPRNHGPVKGETLCTRQIARQGTSAKAYVGLPPDPDDPLLDFEPYLHAAPRSNSITPDLQRAFVAHLAASGIVVSAARAIGKSVEALYKLRKQPGAEGFAAAWDEAAQWGILRLEDCAVERAMAQGLYNMRANSMLAFVLNYRRRERVEVSDLAPGHPVYERIRSEVLQEVGLA